VFPSESNPLSMNCCHGLPAGLAFEFEFVFASVAFCDATREYLGCIAMTSLRPAAPSNCLNENQTT
jgi:hypothetical protein